MAETPAREKLRERILDLAEAILEKDGQEALKARRLAHEAQCSVGTLYNVFQDLDDVILRVNERTLQQLDAAIASMTEPLGDAPLETRLHSVATAYLRFAIAHTSRWLALAVSQLPESGTPSACDQDSLAMLWRHVETPLIPIIPDDAARRFVARATFSAIHGAAAQSLNAKNGEFDANEARSQIAFLVAAIVRHVQTR